MPLHSRGPFEFMTDDVKRKVEAALDSPDLNDAVALLKQGLRRDPYWEWGHRILGDVYLRGLDHASYALVEYRKLYETSDKVRLLDRLRLTWAYLERGFEDKAADVLGTIDPEELPGTLEVLDETFDPVSLFEDFRSRIDKTIEDKSDDLHDKYRQEGAEHLRVGNLYEAEQAFEKALEYRNDAETRLDLARCLIQRSKFPDALEHLKSIRDDTTVAESAESLLADVYRRLGLHDLFEDDEPDGEDANASRKAS